MFSTLDNIKSRIFSNPIEFDRQLHRWRFLSKSIVFTNGCFDILHPGHLHLLSQAADLGDILIVGLNSDNSIQKLKGPERPFIPQQERALTLASLFFIDAVVIFDEDTPEFLIKKIQPNVLVKGADYEEKDIVGADFVKSYGGSVLRVDLLKEFSSSALSKNFF